MNEVVQLDLAGASSFMLEDASGDVPLSESEWANLFLTLGSSDDDPSSSLSANASPALPFEWDFGIGSSSSYSDEMELASTSTIISMMPPPFVSYASPGAGGTTSTSPSSPESGAESSPQSSPQTSPYNDFLFSLPVLAIKDEQTPLQLSSSSAAALPSIEPFPPRSPIFELAHQPSTSSYSAVPSSMAVVGNVGVAAPTQSSDVKTSSSSSSIYGQPLARLVQPAGSVLTSIASPKKAQTVDLDADDDGADVLGKKRRRADPQQIPVTATATAVPSEIAAATSGVVLPRDTLLKLSSAEMEAYLQTLKSSRELTHAEERQLKKQLRLIKNREYAQESRKKKKSAHQEREGELNSLRTQNNELRTHNSALQSEVVLLNSKLAAVTSENTRLRAALRQMQHFHHQSKKNANNKRPRGDDSFDGAPSSPSSWFSLGLGSASVQSPKAVAGGVCLLAVAFFALSFLLHGPGMFIGSPSTAYGGDVDWSRSTARVMLEEGETTTYFRRSIWTASTPTAADSPTSTRSSSSSSEDSKPNVAEGKGVIKCGHDNMCYLYADKAHHIKTAERDPAGLQRDAIEPEILQRQNLTHHAIPIPVH